MELRCFITCKKLRGMHIVGQAVNLSRTAVSIRYPDSPLLEGFPQIGQHIDIEIELPAVAFNRPRSLHCTATICQLPESANGTRCITAVVHDMQFRDLPARFLREPDHDQSLQQQRVS